MASTPHLGPTPLPRLSSQPNHTYAQALAEAEKGPRADPLDPPVFDIAERRPGWGGRVSTGNFFRTDSDRRGGTPLPPEATGDPRPDRLEHAERIRQALEARDNRFKIPLADPQHPAPAPRRHGPRSKTPDIVKPRSYYVDIPAGSAALEARRGGETLYFMTVSDAAYCLTGESRDVWRTAVKNAAGGITKTAFGWEWTRLRSRRGANR